MFRRIRLIASFLILVCAFRQSPKQAASASRTTATTPSSSSGCLLRGLLLGVMSCSVMMSWSLGTS